MQEPLTQAPPPPEQTVQSALLVSAEQAPVAGWQEPASLHSFETVQVTGLEPLQEPSWQVSVLVQALLSVQAVPLTLLAAAGQLTEASQVLAVVHAVTATKWLPKVEYPIQLMPSSV